MVKERRKKDASTEAPPPPTSTTTPHPIRAIRRAGVPLVFIETADPAATIKACIGALNGKQSETILACHDILNGLKGLNKVGVEWASKVSPSPADSSNPAQCLEILAANTQEGSMVFMHIANRFLTNEGVIQGVWNLRDIYKGIQATLIMLGPSVELPAELKNDVIVIEEPVPTAEDIAGVVGMLAKEAGVPVTQEQEPKIVDTMLGYLSLFSVEQSFAMSITKEGVDMTKLWELKVKALKAVAGLEVMLPEEGFNNLAGCRGAKQFISAYLNGKEPPRAVVMWDEVEKMVAGGAGDLSGTTQAMLEQFLYWTEAKKVKGILLVGVPGAGKSATCRATAGEARVPLLRASMSTVKGSLVGQSEQNMRSLLKSIDAVGQGRVLMMATCNSIDALTPEMMARFKLGQFVYVYPDAEEEKPALWEFYMKRYSLTGDTIPDGTDNWVGREVESCCERAWLFNQTLAEAAKTVVPICVSNKDKMDALMQKLSGRFLAASHPGIYRYTPQQSGSAARRINL